MNYFEDLEAYKRSNIPIIMPDDNRLPLRYAVATGKKIHLHSRRGSYTIVKLDGNQLIVTTNKWTREYERGDRKDPNMVTDLSDFKCVEGSPFVNAWNKEKKLSSSQA